MTRPVVTIRDVALEAGVAVSTVSRVINASGAASTSARDRVLAAAEKLGYRASSMARGLRRSRAMTVGVLIPDLANPVFLQWLRGAENAAQERGYSVLTCDGQDSNEIVATQLARLYEHRVDGLLLAGVVPHRALNEFVDSGIPYEPMARNDGPLLAPRVELEREARMAAYRTLVSLGHRRIAFFVREGHEHLHPNALPMVRFASLREALREAGQPEAGASIIEASPTSTLTPVRELVTSQSPPTAYISGTYLLTPSLLIALYSQGVSIPDDVSFLSFGDSPWAIAHRPPLSVVRHDYYAEAKGLMERLIARIEGCDSVPSPDSQLSEFVQRGSLGPPPPEAFAPSIMPVRQP